MRTADPGGVAVDVAGWRLLLLAVSVGPILLLLLCSAASAADRIYWGNYDGDSIAFANLDGSGGALLPTPNAPKDGPHGFSIDESTQRVYWANFGEFPNGAGDGAGTSLSFAGLDGSGGASLISGGPVSGPHGTAIDGGKVYWPNDGDNTIRYVNLNGSGDGVLPVGSAVVDGPRGVALDQSSGRIYWANYNGNSISYANLDGSGGGNINTTGATVAMPEGPAIFNGRIYWGNFSAASVISYANLDGSGGNDLPTPGATVSYPHGVAIDAETQSIYWPNYVYLGGSISYAKLDGSGGNDLPIGSTPINGPAQPIVLHGPSLQHRPEISGASKPGAKLSCQAAKWAGDDTAAHFYRAPASTSRVWLENGKPVKNQTGNTLKVHDIAEYSCLDSATNAAGTSAKASDPIGVFKIGPLHRNLANGSAKLVVKVPAAGVVKLRGRGIAKRRSGADARTSGSLEREVKGGRVKLKIKPKGKVKRRLLRTGKAKVKIRVSYRPSDGIKGTQKRTLKLEEG